MQPHDAKPGPRDGSDVLVAGLAGVCIGLVLFVLYYLLAPSAGAYGVIPFLIVGAVVGTIAGLLRRRSRKSHRR